MYGRSFGTASGDYIVPERYGGTVYKRRQEKTETPENEEPRLTPVNGGLRLSQTAAEMHGKDIRRITGEPDETPEDKPSGETAGSEAENSGAESPHGEKKRFPGISEEDLLVIGLVMLMLGFGGDPPRADGDAAPGKTAADQPSAVSEAAAAVSHGGGDDLL
ncbi:MAG: hypothetical protein J5940_07385, partial [Clostridia bacterium]|nr:hypothetical protein [Clostridia bacterium]